MKVELKVSVPAWHFERVEKTIEAIEALMDRLDELSEEIGPLPVELSDLSPEGDVRQQEAALEAALEDARCNLSDGWQGRRCLDCGATDYTPDHDLCRSDFDRAMRIAPAAVQDVGLKPDAPLVIGLCGAAGAGKSAAAAVLGEYGYQRISFADPLKAMLRTLYASAGVSPDEIERKLAGDLKETRCQLLGVSPRVAMQTLGTEWGRKLIGSDIWVRIARRRVREVIARGGRVVIDDCRMPNEAEMIRTWWATVSPVPVSPGCEIGQLWLVAGRGGIAGNHSSETALADVTPDKFLDNSGGLDALEKEILQEVLG